VFTKELLEPLGIDRILLVTSAIHMPRAVGLFEHQGFEVVPAPTDFQVTEARPDLPFRVLWPNYLFGLFPTSENLNDTTQALKEYIGIAVYRLRGWME